MRELPAAYGLRVPGLPSTPWLAVGGAEDWPALRIERRPGGPPASDPAVDPASLRVSVSAAAGIAELVAPALAQIARRIAPEQGLEVRDAGAISLEGKAYAVVAADRAGRSSFLAACAAAGATVVSDELLVLSGGAALAGPRCIDLRGDVAPRFAEGIMVQPAAPRWRLTLPPAAAEHPLAGVVRLFWADDPVLREGTGGELPLWELGRPRELDALPESAELLLGELAPSLAA